MIPLTAKVISPTVFADAMLTSSTVPETDYSEWAAATAYALAQRCIRVSMHRVYQRIIAGTTATAPESDAANWLDIGPTNRWAMFDDVVGTSTSDTDLLFVVMRPGSVSGLALLEIDGRSVEVSMKDAPGGSTVYSKTVDLDGTIITSVYDWFYQPFDAQETLLLTDLPWHYAGCELTVSIIGTSTVSCGVCKFGEVIGLGGSEYGAKSGIVDYSVKSVDSFGRYSIVKRNYSKRMSIPLITNKSDYNRISRALSALRATPAVWIATEMPGFDALTIYGFYKDFSIDVAYERYHYCSLEIEGLI